MEFLILATTHFLALLIPGADFFMILQTSLRKSKAESILLCVGIAFAHGLYLGFAIFQIELIRQSDFLMPLIQLLGGGYLFYIGFMLLKSKKESSNEIKVKSFFIKSDFLNGFLTAFLNPKNAIFYLSLFGALVSPSTPLPIKLLYGLWMVSVIFIWDSMIALLLNKEAIKKRFFSYLYIIEKVAGAVLLFLGLKLIFMK